MTNDAQLLTEEQAFVACLHKLAEVYKTDPAYTEDQRLSLSLLIETFNPLQDPEFENALSALLSEGWSVQELREGLAADAGIVSYAQLYFFATLDVRLATGELQTVNLTGLSDEDFLALFTEG